MRAGQSTRSDWPSTPFPSENSTDEVLSVFPSQTDTTTTTAQLATRGVRGDEVAPANIFDSDHIHRQAAPLDLTFPFSSSYRFSPCSSTDPVLAAATSRPPLQHLCSTPCSLLLRGRPDRCQAQYKLVDFLGDLAAVLAASLFSLTICNPGTSKIESVLVEVHG